MSRRAGARLLLRGLWWRRTLNLAVLTVAAVTTTLAALGPLYARASSESVLQDHLTSAGHTAGLHFRTRIAPGAPSQVTAFRNAVPRPGELPGYDRVLPSFTTAASMTAYPVDRRTDEVFTSLSWRAGQCAHVVVVSGHCPTDPGEAMASERTISAGIYDWHLGTTVALPGVAYGPRSRGSVTTLRLVGVYRPKSPGATYWFGQEYFDAHPFHSPRVPDGPATVDTLFVAQHEFTAGPPDTRVEADLDFPLDASSVRLDDVPAETEAVDRLLTAHRSRDAIELETRLPQVFAQAAAERHQVNVDTLLVTLQLAALAWLVLFQVVADALDARRNESVLAKLHGYSPLHTARFSLAEPIVLLLLAVPIGLLAAFGVTRLFAVSVLVPGVPVLVTWPAAWAALGAFGGGVVATALAGRRIVARSVLDHWRGTERRPGPRRVVLAIDLVLAAGAVIAFVAVRNASRASDGRAPLALLAPALLIFAVATGGVLLLPPACRRIGDRTRTTAHIGTFLAARQVSRRPVRLRLAALLAVAVGLATLGVAGETVARANRVARADAELGADRVLSVRFAPGVDPVAATHRADPDGRWAMTAATWLPDGGDSINGTLLGVDAARLPAVALPVAGGPSARTLASLIAAADVAPVVVHTERMRLHLSIADLAGDRAPDVQLNLRTTQDPFVRAEGGTLQGGSRTYAISVPCRTGCSLDGITWDRPISARGTLSGSVTLTGMDTYRGGHWAGLPIGLGKAGSWYRLTPQGQADDRVTATRSGIRDRFVSSNGGYGGIAYAADPSPLPVVATPEAIISAALAPRPRQLIDGTQTVATIRIAARARTLAQLGNFGLVADVWYVRDELPGFADEASWQVWVGAHAPGDYRRQLTRAGLQITSEHRISDRVERLSRQAPALALLLLLVCALGAALLSVGGMAISVSASSRQRSYELAALTALRVPRRPLLRAALTEQLLLLGAAGVLGVPAGLVAAWLTLPIVPQFADPTSIRLDNAPHLLPTLEFVAAFAALLVVTALVGARRLIRRSSPSRLRSAE